MDAATPGPWEAYNANEGTDYLPAWEVANDAFHNPPADENAPWIAVHLETGIREDAEFIAHARTDIPALVADLDAARREWDAWRDAANGWEAKAEEYAADLDAARQERDEARATLSIVEANFRELEAERDRTRPVVEAAKAWRDHLNAYGAGLYYEAIKTLAAAVDTYETQTGGTE